MWICNVLHIIKKSECRFGAMMRKIRLAGKREAGKEKKPKKVGKKRRHMKKFHPELRVFQKKGTKRKPMRHRR